MNLAVRGRQYQCSHFLLVLCNSNCRHKTETALHYSHILPLYCIPIRLVMPSLDTIGSYSLDEPCIYVLFSKTPASFIIQYSYCFTAQNNLLEVNIIWTCKGYGYIYTESSDYYARPQTAAARGLDLPTRGLAAPQTAGASKHSLCYFNLFSE